MPLALRVTAGSLAVVATLACSGVARARPGRRVITVDLVSEPRDLPSFACVVHSFPTTATRTGLGDLLDPNSRVSRMSRSDGTTGGTLGVPSPPDPPTDPLELQVYAEVRSAFEAMSAPSVASCGAGSSACSPTFSVKRREGKDRQYIQCAGNSVAVEQTGSPRRVLVLAVDVPAPERFARVESVFLTGNVVSIRLAGDGVTQDEPDTAVATVLGGHYDEGTTASAVANRIQLPIVPRCHTREIRIPPVDASHRDLEVSYAVKTPTGSDLVVCDAAADAPLTVLVPSAHAKAEVDGITVNVRDTDPEKSGVGGPAIVARFATSWTSRNPPEHIEFRPRSISFQWHPPCDYPMKIDHEHAEACPRVSLADAGLDCMAPIVPRPKGRQDQRRRGGRPGDAPMPRSASVPDQGTATIDDTCQYTCPAGAVTSSLPPLPLNVRFEAPSNLGTWFDVVRRVDDTLVGYVTSDAKQFLLDVEAEPRARHVEPRGIDVPGDRLATLEVTSANGAVHSLVPTPDAQPFTPDARPFALPGAGCHEILRYRWTGDREYDQSTVTLNHGRLEVPHPWETARILSVPVEMAGGALWLASKPFAPASFDPRPTGILSGALRFHLLTLPRVSIEIRVTNMFSIQPYGPLNTVDNSASAYTPNAPYDRLVLSFPGVMALGNFIDHPIEIFGDPLAFGAGFPLQPTDSAYVGGTRGIWAPSAGLRWTFRIVSLTGSLRGVYPDPIYQYTSANFLGNPAQNEHDVVSYGVDLGVGISVF